MEKEEMAYLESMQQQKDQAINQQNQMTGATNSMFSGQQDTNLIEWQLELDNILERIEHLLKGDILSQDKEGNIFWKAQVDNNLKPLNEFGVQFLMNTLSFYLNRNTILSNYSEDRISEILYDIGYELTDQIYLNAEKMGLNTPHKQSRYSILVLQIIHTIESAYNRAYGGAERESLRTARIVTQSDNLNLQQQFSNVQKPQSFSFFNPKTWVK